MPRHPPEPSPYDDPFYSFNLVGYGPDAPINIVRAQPPGPPAPVCMDASQSIGKPLEPVAPPEQSPDSGTPEPNRGGRPTKIDPAKQEAFCCLIRAGCSRTVAARLLGVNRRTLWYAAHNDPEFKERVLSAERQCEALAYSNIARAGSQSWRASAWLVDRRHRRRERARAPSVRAVLQNREFQTELKSLVRQLLPAQPADEPRIDPDLDQFRHRDRTPPNHEPNADAPDPELAAVRSRLLDQIQTNCTRRAPSVRHVG